MAWETIIKEANIVDRTARRILSKLAKSGKIEIVGNNMSPNKKYKIKE